MSKKNRQRNSAGFFTPFKPANQKEDESHPDYGSTSKGYWSGGTWHPFYRGNDSLVHIPVTAHQDDTFHCDVDSVTACSRAPVPEIVIDSNLWQVLIELCASSKDEWLGYLTGTIEGGKVSIEDIYFPPQVAGGAHVHNQTEVAFKVKANTIGAIHSHVQMQAFFSSTDKEHANWPVEIVLNAKGEYQANMRVVLPCGESMRRDAKVFLIADGFEEIAGELKAALEAGEAARVAALAKEAAERGSRMLPSVYSTGYSSPRKLADKFYLCPVCKNKALTCSDNIPAMEKVMTEMTEKQRVDFWAEDTKAYDAACAARNVPQPSKEATSRPVCPLCYEEIGTCEHTYHATPGTGMV